MYRIDFRFLRLLHQFSAVAEAKKISLAAQRLNLSQPPLSHDISELESLLGYPLFDRLSRGVRLTAAGETLLPLVNDFLSHAETVADSIKEYRPDQRQVLTIASTYDSMLHVIPLIKEQLKQTESNISIYTKEVYSTDVESLILADDVNLGLGYLYRVESPELTIQSLVTLRFKVVLPIDHRLAKYSSVPVEALKEEALVLVRRGSSSQYCDRVLDIFRKHKINPIIRHEVISISRQIGFVACGQGIAIMPEWRSLTLPSNLKALDIEDEDANITLSAVWKKARKNKTLETVLSLAANINYLD